MGHTFSELSPAQQAVYTGSREQITHKEQEAVRTMPNVNVKVSIPVIRCWKDPVRHDECTTDKDYQVEIDGKDVVLRGEGQELRFELADFNAAVEFLKPKTPAIR